MKQEEIKNKAFKYYCMGLNSKEIGKLLDLSYRTVQNYMSSENWKGKRTPLGLSEHIVMMKNKGKSYNQIADQLKISRSTVYKHLKQAKESRNKAV